ncbi:MAG: M12 family metallo-peptidase [Ignavibacteria bacterium]|nr:M12 family metallo-peptidase [Ignavibacteria bacterium]
MKNYFYKSILLVIPLSLIVIIFSAFESEQTSLPAGYKDKDHINASAELIKSKRNVFNFKSFSLFSEASEPDLHALNTFVSKSSFLRLERNELDKFNTSRPDNILFRLDYSGKVIELELTRVDLIPDGFRIEKINGSERTYEPYSGGLYYQGIMKGNENSFATLSVFPNSVFGMIYTDEGNYVLGSIKDENKNLTDKYMLYNDRDILINSGFQCSTREDLYRLSSDNPAGNSFQVFTTQPIEKYFVCDYRMYLDNGSSAQNVANFVSAMFLNVRTLYQNEQIPVALAPFLSVYTSQDPYMNINDSYGILNLFGGNTQNNFQGDLAHLLSTRNAQLGGIAWIRVLCQSYVYFPPPDDAHFGRFAFSNIENSYLPYPQYSWTVEVVTHEAGHNIGSRHTHSCTWPTVSGQIDSCVSIQGESCVQTTRPNNNGTIMSYCHLNGGINFLRGFGPLPGDTIRLRYSQAHCIDSALNSSEIPVSFLLLQNYPNPFNPSTTIRFGLPEEGYVSLRVYDVTGREVAELINDRYYNAGTFSYIFNVNEFNLSSGVYFYRLDVTRENKKVYTLKLGKWLL